MCCSTCVEFGDTNQDSEINVLDVVETVTLVLGGSYDQIADMNSDGSLNVLDVVSLVNVILDQSIANSDTSEADVF